VKKVKEYLDKNFHILQVYVVENRSYGTNKSNGVFGEWCYPSPDKQILHDTGIPDAITENGVKKQVVIGKKEKNLHSPINIIQCSCNNQTMQFFIKINGVSVSTYGYLQTYDYIPRGEPDRHGYYARSTDEEVIKYIKSYKTIIDRENKLKNILK